MSRPRGRKLGVYSLGLLRNHALKSALASLGWDVVAGPFHRDLDAIAVWGGRPVAARGERAAERRDLPLVRLEDAFLRSVTASEGEPIMGLTLDETGNYLDASGPSDLENLLNRPLGVVGSEVEAAFEAYLRSGLSKYNDAWRLASDLPDAPFVLVVDQLRGDASIRLGGAGAPDFADMLAAAIAENPDTPIYVKRHPRAVDAPELGHFVDFPDGVAFLEDGFAISDVLERASSVYCVTSQVGFEAILRGFRPRVFGASFYAGWGLSEDEKELPRRGVSHTALSLFERVMMEYPLWFDVYSGGSSDFGSALRGLAARKRSHEIKREAFLAVGMRLWKRGFVRQFLGDVRFGEKPVSWDARKIVAWASAKTRFTPDIRMEDGFLRSVGLGAELAAPLSFCLDDLGIYYDPNQESRLERLIGESGGLSAGQLARARSLREALVARGLSKYNVGSTGVDVPEGRSVILVPGQVEDDASIRLGAGEIATNEALLEAVRAANPEAYILFKPHPDVEAGLREGAVADPLSYCDQVLDGVSAQAALDVADEVWTMTSLMGFEALLRGKRVTCFGRPFYAGWGLTDDRGDAMERRRTKASLDGLVHASLIDYPIYRDPVSGLACPVEVIVDRLAQGEVPPRPGNRALSKLQGLFANYTWLWR